MYRLRSPFAARASMRAWTGALSAKRKAFRNAARGLCRAQRLQSRASTDLFAVSISIRRAVWRAEQHAKEAAKLCDIVAAFHCPQRYLMHMCVRRLSGALVNMQRSGQLTSVTAANR